MLEVYEYVRFQLKRIFNTDIELYELALLTAALVRFFSGCIFLYYVFAF